MTNEGLVADWVKEHFAAKDRYHWPAASRLAIRAVVVQPTYLALRATLLNGATRLFSAFTNDEWRSGWIGAHRAWTRDRAYAPVIIQLDNAEFAIVAYNDRHLAEATVRFIREYLRTQLAVQGALTLHASFATAEPLGGVLILGSSGAGKTTLALALGRRGAFISGDQTELLQTKYGSIGVGFPWLVTLSPNALDSVGVSPTSARNGLLRRVPSGKLAFTQAEVMRHLGANVISTACVNVVVVLQSQERGSEPVAIRANLAEYAAAVGGHLREPDPSFPCFWLSHESIAPGTTSDLIGALDAVPIIELSWDPNQQHPGSALEAIEAAL